MNISQSRFSTDWPSDIIVPFLLKGEVFKL